MTPDELEELQRVVALHMSFASPNMDLTWHEWAGLLQKRLAAITMWTVDDTRPTFRSALMLASDAMTLLALVDAAETADHATEDAA